MLQRSAQAEETARFYTTQQVVEATRVTPRMLQWWNERGVIVPIADGRTNKYAYQQVIEVSVVWDFRQRGLALSRIRKMLRSWRRAGGRSAIRFIVFTNAGPAFLKDSMGLLQHLAKATGGTFTVDLQQHYTRLRQELLQGL